MYHLDNIVAMYFNSISARDITDRKASFDGIHEQLFMSFASAYLSQYSDTENRQLYWYIQDSVRQEGHPYAALEHRSGLNVFAALEELAEELLVLENDVVLCQYSNLIRFRNVSQYVEEDLIVCAFLAIRDRRYGSTYQDFGWDFVIGHNNVQLERILEKGISENHFHLFGSAPSFHLIWVHFMNHVDLKTLFELDKAVEKQRRVIRKHYDRDYDEDSFAAEVLKAMLIRVRLVYGLVGAEEAGRRAGARQWSGFEDGEIGALFSDREIEQLLSGEKDILERCSDIQKAVTWMADCAFFEGMGNVPDYALYRASNAGNRETYNSWAAGERWLMYRMLVRELNYRPLEESWMQRYFNWFYLYLVLKQKVRNEIIQTNEMVGFENFSIYTHRKKYYRNTVRSIETAVYGSVGKGNLRCLEIRVTPERTSHDNFKWIREMDGIIGQRRQQWYPQLNYYYVFHFTKEQDAPLGERRDFDGLHCRHFQKRQDIQKRAYGIAVFRERYRKYASRVLGIDACSQEIGCRPEVFATIFRFLAAHTVNEIPGEEQVPQLRMTYHVGEDFLDFVDGLRAVDEAVSFLNLRCGDRIGHGTVLGLDVRLWYEFKQNTIVLTQQDYLDNIVWLYHKLIEYRIEGFENLKAHLLQEFHFYFSEIYPCSSFIPVDEVVSDDTAAVKFLFDIDIYYEAWKLRGDAPELYKTGKFHKEAFMDDREWMVNRIFPREQRNRYRDVIGRLYYLYHYDWNVRYKGGKNIQKYVSPDYVEGVAAVQKAVQRDFVSRGIGIEANPSSNLAISTMRKYSEHPIVRLYNKDLTWDIGKLQECPQANISINTDDKGVFHTSLENEYALMACAMEKERDENGNPVYNRQMVYQWIDNIREMGNMQSFQRRRE